MKKKVFLVLFLGATSLVYSQQNNNNLHEIFDSEAFEIMVPDTWKEVEPYYPFNWVKQYVLKDSLSKGYFRIGQFEIKNSNRSKLRKIVNTRNQNLKKARYKKFSSTIKKKESNFENHYVLNTSWRSWQDKNVTLKHTTEYIQKDNIVYVLRYSDSTYSSSSFNNDVQKMIASFKIKRKAKGLLIKKEIPKSELKNHFKKYTLTVPENWYGFISETGDLQFAPYEFDHKEYTRNRNVFFVKEYTDNDFYGENLLEFVQKRYKYINSFYRKLKTTRRKAAHNKYGNYFLIQYSNRVMVLNNNKLSSTTATVAEAIIVYKMKKYILTYYFENSYFNDYVKQVNEMINSFEIKE
ncbi:hypothetical protein [Polaribacter uvawellassae]|uniref:hypothetical protein n=1 Tax=Polaribacter uvawellassae TaxID=3133495 RepID=UPI003219F2C3